MIPALLAVLFLPIFQSEVPSTDTPPWSVKQLVEYQMHAKRSLHVQDVYKLLFEANFGVGHMLPDSLTALRAVQEELQDVGPSPVEEPAMERISTVGTVVRVNLRHLDELNLSPAELVELMLQSARETRPDTLMFYRQWNEFSGLVRYGLLDFPRMDLDEWDARVASGNLGAVHHSEEYRAANQPAYRVVLRTRLEQMIEHKTSGE